VIDAVLAIAPVVTGYRVRRFVDDRLPAPLAVPINALAMLTVTGVVEFVSTLWCANVVLQRGVSVAAARDGT